jgi:OTU domain-containing protein 5
MTLHTMDSDGNCLFKAISHQLYGDPQHHLLCRKAACSYMLYHKNKLANFVVGDFEQYVQRMQQPGVWGDELELRALSQVYHRPIWLFSVNDRETPLKISEPNVEQQTPMLLSYHLRSHYNSLTQQFWLKLNYRPGEWERTLELEYSLLQPE